MTAATTSRTCTLVFTDIEGSTTLLTRLGTQWAAVLGRHHEIVSEVVSATEGDVVDTQGDAFFLLYGEAPAAVEFARRVTHRLDAEPWPDGAQVRIRIGVHTGTVELAPTGPVGLDVHKAARVASAAHGGQAILTASTRERLTDVDLLDLGLHRLKDIPTPLQLWQVTAPDLADDFPPLRSLDARREAVPDSPRRLLGRANELDRLCGQLADGARLITVVGPGGVGKTSLALEAARRRLGESSAGAAFVGLAPETRVDGVIPRIAAALGVDVGDDAAADLGAALAKERLLLVLDNLEQVPGVGSVLGELLDRTAAVQVLATSRTPLDVRAEQVLWLDALGLPQGDDVADVSDAAASRLFAARAADARPGFVLDAANAADVAALCRHLDGLPLALELAAARVRTLTPHDLLRRLRDSTQLLRSSTRDVDPRQRSLQATIDWSVELLPEPARDLFAGLACFAGDWSLERLEQICTAYGFDDDVMDLLDVLVAHSLVRPIDTGDRLRMSVPVREAAERRAADAGTADSWARAHLAAYLGLAQAAIEHPGVPPWVEHEIDELRRAVRTARAEDPMQWALLVGLINEWLGGGRDVMDEVSAALALPDLPDFVHARLLEASARLAVMHGRWADGIASQDAAVAAWRRVGHTLGLAGALCGRAMIAGPDDVEAVAWCDEAAELIAGSGRQDLAQYPLWARAQIMVQRHDVAAASQVLAQLQSMPPGPVEDVRRTVGTLHFTADCHLLLGDGRAAVEAYGRALRHASTRGLLAQCVVELEGLAQALAVDGDLASAFEVLLGSATLRASVDGVPDLPWWRAMVDQTVADPAVTRLDLDQRFAAESRVNARGAEGAIEHGLQLSRPGGEAPSA